MQLLIYWSMYLLTVTTSRTCMLACECSSDADRHFLKMGNSVGEVPMLKSDFFKMVVRAAHCRVGRMALIGGEKSTNQSKCSDWCRGSCVQSGNLSIIIIHTGEAAESD